MKFYLLPTLIVMASSMSVGAESTAAASPQVSQERVVSFPSTIIYPPDKKVSLVLKNCSISEFGAVLANLTQKEVLISYRVKHTIIPDIVVDDYPDKALELILARIKSADIRIAELYPYTLVFFECPASILDPTFKLK